MASLKDADFKELEERFLAHLIEYARTMKSDKQKEIEEMREIARLHAVAKTRAKRGMFFHLLEL